MPRLAGLLITCVVLAGCGQAPVKPAMTQVVTQTVTQYVPVPEALTTPCPVAERQSSTVAEAVRIAKARRDALERCNGQLEAIRSLGH